MAEEPVSDKIQWLGKQCCFCAPPIVAREMQKPLHISPIFLSARFSYCSACIHSTWKEMSCTINLLQIQKQEQKIDGAT